MQTAVRHRVLTSCLMASNVYLGVGDAVGCNERDANAGESLDLARKTKRLASCNFCMFARAVYLDLGYDGMEPCFRVCSSMLAAWECMWSNTCKLATERIQPGM